MCIRDRIGPVSTAVKEMYAKMPRKIIARNLIKAVSVAIYGSGDDGAVYVNSYGAAIPGILIAVKGTPFRRIRSGYGLNVRMVVTAGPFHFKRCLLYTSFCSLGAANSSSNLSRL